MYSSLFTSYTVLVAVHIERQLVLDQSLRRMLVYLTAAVAPDNSTVVESTALVVVVATGCPKRQASARMASVVLADRSTAVAGTLGEFGWGLSRPCRACPVGFLALLTFP